MPTALRIALFSCVCCGFALGCSDPTQDPSKVPRAVAPGDSPAQALPNMPLANKPTEPAPIGDSAPGVAASVEIKPWSADATSDNKVSGAIQFAPTSSGMEVSGALKNLPKGLHGLHIHENGECSKPGGHLAPAGNRHGDPTNGEHHLGDLGNVEADASNQAAGVDQR